MAAKFKDVVEARIAANTTSDTVLLRELADHYFLYVRVAVAQNPASSVEALLALISPEQSDDAYQVAAAALRHPAGDSKLCVAALNLLGTSSRIEARNWAGRDFVRALFSHPNLPIEPVRAIAPDLPDHLRSLIATSSNNRSILQVFTQDRSPSIARKASNRLQSLGTSDTTLIIPTSQQ